MVQSISSSIGPEIGKVSKYFFISDIGIYIHKKVQFSITEVNIEIKTTATAEIKNELKYYLMSEGNSLSCNSQGKENLMLIIYNVGHLPQFAEKQQLCRLCNKGWSHLLCEMQSSTFSNNKSQL